MGFADSHPTRFGCSCLSVNSPWFCRRLPRAEEVREGPRRFQGKLPAAKRLSPDDVDGRQAREDARRPHLLDDGLKADRAKAILGPGPRIRPEEAGCRKPGSRIRICAVETAVGLRQ